MRRCDCKVELSRIWFLQINTSELPIITHFLPGLRLAYVLILIFYLQSTVKHPRCNQAVLIGNWNQHVVIYIIFLKFIFNLQLCICALYVYVKHCFHEDKTKTILRRRKKNKKTNTSILLLSKLLESDDLAVDSSSDCAAAVCCSFPVVLWHNLSTLPGNVFLFFCCIRMFWKYQFEQLHQPKRRLRGVCVSNNYT